MGKRLEDYNTRSKSSVFVVAFDDAEGIEKEFKKSRSKLGKYYLGVLKDIMESETTYEEVILNYREVMRTFAEQEVYDRIEWSSGRTRADDLCTDDNHSYDYTVEKVLDDWENSFNNVLMDKEYIAEIEYDNIELRKIMYNLKCTVLTYEKNL